MSVVFLVSCAIIEDLNKNDLEISQFSANPTTVGVENDLTLSATIQNSKSITTTLRYYRSINSEIDTNDVEIYMETISSSGTKEYITIAPTTADNYYYGACVDTNENETNTNNNCSVGSKVMVTDEKTNDQNDLEISQFSANPTTVGVGNDLTLLTTIQNSKSITTTLRYYRSINSEIDTNDVEIDMETISSSGTKKYLTMAPTTSGNYYYGACVDTNENETNTNNNCSVGSKVMVTDEKTNDLNDLVAKQWHLKSNSGFDLNLDKVTQTGFGLVVNIIDTGIEKTHEDLAANIIGNFTGNNGEHGTSVAGIIAAVDNGLGVKGVASEAKLIAHDPIQDTLTDQEKLITSIIAVARIANQSFGSHEDLSRRISEDIKTAYTDGIDKNDTIYVKSASNNFSAERRIANGNIYYNCILAEKTPKVYPLTDYFTSPLSCGNANIDPYNTLPYNIVVAAVTESGTKDLYSNNGSAILVSGFGGNSSNGIITTDKSGCDKGTNQKTKDDDPSCNYTSFTGTSAAAATVTGVIALMVEAQPQLSWRDVRHILVHTSRKVDSTKDTIKTKSNVPSHILRDATTELGWIKNAAGHEFHNSYGFGLVDANSAITMALDYTNFLAKDQLVKNEITFDKTKNSKLSIPEKSYEGVVITIDFNISLKIESVQIDVNILHNFPPDLGISLVSPSGTESFLFTPFNQFLAYKSELNGVKIISKVIKNLDFVLASQAFYGEEARGVWKLRIVDYVENDEMGFLENFKLIIYGE